MTILPSTAYRPPMAALTQGILIIPTLQQLIDVEARDLLCDLDFQNLSLQMQRQIPVRVCGTHLSARIHALGQKRHAGSGTLCDTWHKSCLLLSVLKEMDYSGQRLPAEIRDSLATYFAIHLEEHFIVREPMSLNVEPESEQEIFIGVTEPDTRIIRRSPLWHIRALWHQWRHLSRQLWQRAAR